MESKIHFLKKISGWHYVYIIVILIIVIIGLISYNYSRSTDFVALVSFAATISSIILSVLAIIITVLSGESMNNLRDGLLGMTKIPQDVKNAMDSTLQAITTSTDKLKDATNSNDKMVNKINE